MPGAERHARVLHVAHNAAPHLGGLEAVVAAETRGLVRRGRRVSLLTSAWGPARPGTRTEDGVRVVRLRAWHGLEERFGVPFPVFTPWLPVAAFREVRRADLVHVHDPLYLTSWAAALACRLTRTPYVVHQHVGFVHHPALVVRLVQLIVVQTVGRLVLGGARAILPIDEGIAASTRQRYGDRVHVLGNAVDTRLFRPAEPAERRRTREQRGLPTDLPLVLSVGRLVPKKGFAEVAAAADDGYRIAFVGGDRPAGLPDERLVFLGGLPPAEVAEVVRAADVVVVASVGEAPLTVLEALASGVCVVAHDDPALRGSPWTAGPGVEFVDVAAGGLRDRLRTLLAGPAALAARGAEARRFVVDRFSWDRHLDALEAAYDR